MKVGIPREIKNHEYRVAITPPGVSELVRAGHDVFVEEGAGVGSFIADAQFAAAGAKVLPTPEDVWGTAELVLKVKEPVEAEYDRLREGQTLFTYLHLAASRACTDALLRRKVTAIAYETVQLPDRSLPLLTPMSEVAGRLATQAGAYHLMAPIGGGGVLLGGIPGVAAAKVVVIGGGVAGENAATIAVGMRADVTVLDLSPSRLRELDARYDGRVRTLTSSAYTLAEEIRTADLVIGAVLIPGTRAPKLVSNELVAQMKPGSVLVDIAIDQGGCFEDSRPTTHSEPTYRVHDSIFYCVANMPGAVPNTSTQALSNVTLPYVLALAGGGVSAALRADAALAKGLNTYDGQVVYQPVAQAHDLPFISLADALS